ncbi:hypothetical protein BDZ91DRAFT_793427 [Kalaharituber pfeilii]|nr:hypothetical protein BDZ91DRAFT_793427 [Kalaharituber pfeilii]
MRGRNVTGSRPFYSNVVPIWKFLILLFFIQLFGAVWGQQHRPVSAGTQPVKGGRAHAHTKSALSVPPAGESGSLATISPQPLSLQSSYGFNGDTALGAPRSITDWKMGDFVLIAMVDGTLQARERKTGSLIWELLSDTPVVQTVYHRRNDTSDRIDDDDFVWIVEPIEEGALFRYHPELGLERTGMTMKKLVERSPMWSTDTRRAYSGEKQTVTYAIDGRTGDILRVFKTGGGARMLVDTSRCKPKEADDLEDECENRESDKTILVARTEYTVTVEDMDTNELLWTLKYTEWGPNNSDLDLAAQYREPMDDRYIYALHNGRILGFDRSRGSKAPPVYDQPLASPVARVFDVIKSSSADKTNFLVLPQPFVDAERPHVDKTYVGCTEQGGWYALSELHYPFVSESGSAAPCYRLKPQLSKLEQPEKMKVLVGVHPTNHYSPPAEPAFIGGKQPLLIGAPTENRLDKPKSSESTDKALPSSPSTAIKRLGMTYKWNIALAIPFLLGFLYYWFDDPRLPVMGKGKWSFDAAIKDSSIVVPEAKTDATNMETLEPRPGNSPMTAIPLPVTASEPISNFEAMPEVKAKVETEPQPTTQPVEEADVKPKIGRQEVSSVSEERHLGSDSPPIKADEESQVANGKTDGALVAQETPNSEDTPAPQPPPNLDASVLPEVRIVRFEERPKTPLNDAFEDEKEPPTPTTSTPKKRKAHRGQRGKKKKANKAQQAEESDEIGRIVDRAKDIQQTARNLEPDVKVINESGDIDSSIIRIDNLEVHQNAQSTLGLGSQGTVVFKGKFEGRAVAVKRMLRTFFDVAHREVKLLQDSDDHPNVIRYHCMKELDQFLYIALEQCRASLCDVVIEPKHADLRQLLDPQQVLKQIASGVNHLHQMKIVHRDLKPQNILVSEPKRFPRDPSKVQHPRILISDFGLCKQLEANQSSFRATTAHAAGTSGWRAPELLMDDGSMDMRPFSSSTVSETSGSSTETAIFEGLPNRRATRAIDVFSMGCVFFFVLTQGGHPFGAMKYSREMNVITGSSDLSPLEALDETGYLAKDLIRKMIQRHPKARPDTQTILMHPYFWTPEKRLLFLIDSSDRFEKEKDLEKEGRYKSPHIQVLERDARNIVRSDWLKRIDRAFHEEITANKRRGYDGEKVLDLLRVIRNKRNHYQDMSKAAQAAVGPLPEGYLNYFTTRFPDLFLHVYRVNMETGFASKDLRAYYTPPDV